MAALFEGQAASVALHSALHPVRCLTRHVQLLGVHNTSFARSLWSGIDNVFTQVPAPVPLCAAPCAWRRRAHAARGYGCGMSRELSGGRFLGYVSSAIA